MSVKKPSIHKSKKSKDKKQKKPAKIQSDDLILELTTQMAGMEDKHLRLKAEFDNYRKRKDRELGQLLIYEGSNVITEFISVMDDLERMQDAIDSDSNGSSDTIREGIDMIMKKIHKRFEALDVQSFTEPGETLDLELHEAMLVRNEKGKKENEILEVFEKGYRYKDKILRHAKVIVNKVE
ncbi:MAG: nucleotide exchange factor GrpE [Candidatus Marinimicrobia bacterium]|jgi:molecular chaperone GrpE|nr:nucleotide exchange factor GrpE [Candidatus Neomarinimicrobiota bacterium]MBT3618124.1 nucleotide exchange factor GrpE [Candidatus Neomarinimicrobiota bacterium]MBT3828595.1 nucleotide exchange factor GrpE [Candidatus Neomarinimicrobiota bacterium]MBT3996943.1 nucleotide exchange factor GrpE [Candidatus Neomarinimicrobiota bacterium]MBT4280907.1 nucleotide exchange factor GrpE [Candidatus Neomarinimicrobiota bacterium]